MQSKISVIIPVYNEAGVIEQVVRDFYEEAVKKIPNTTFIIAEDGSTDGTKDILRKLNEEIPFVLISGNKRKGYTKVFKDTLATAQTELVFFSDSDAQHDPADFFKLLKEINGYDIVSGFKCPRRDSFHRIIISKAYNALIFLMFGIRMKDIDSGFKLVRKKVIDNILKDVAELRYCVMSEFVLKAYISGYRIKEVPVGHYKRTSGATAIFTPTKLVLIIIGIIIGLFRIKMNYKEGRRK